MVKRKTEILICIFFLASWVAGELPKLFWPWTVTLLDVSALLILTHIVIANLPAGKAGSPDLTKGRRGNPAMKFVNRIFLILFASWVFSLRLLSLSQAFPGFLYLSKAFVFALLIVNASLLLKHVKMLIPTALWTFVILGLFQYFLIPDTRFLLRYGWDEHYYRLIATVLDPHYAGAIFGMILLFAFGQFSRKQSNKLVVLGAMSLIGLALTFSRASWLASGVSLLFYLTAKGPSLLARTVLHKMEVIVCVIFLSILLLAPKPGGEGVNLLRTNSISQRVESWRQGLAVWREHLFFGVGFNNYRVANEKDQILLAWKNDHAGNSPDSSWVLLLATTGGIGSVGVIWEIRKIIPDLRKRQFLFSLLLLVGIHSLFNNTLFYPPVLGLLALMAASSL